LLGASLQILAMCVALGGAVIRAGGRAGAAGVRGGATLPGLARRVTAVLPRRDRAPRTAPAAPATVAPPPVRPAPRPHADVVPAPPRPAPEATPIHAVEPVADDAAVAERELAPACEIVWWRGYVKSQFVAMATASDGRRVEIATSSAFKWRKDEPPPETPEAVQALNALVASLEADGWSLSDRGAEWFALRLGPSSPD